MIMKKGVTLLLAVVMAFGLSTSVFAASTKYVQQTEVVGSWQSCNQTSYYADAEGYTGTLTIFYSYNSGAFTTCFYQGNVTKP
ncbi:MAG: hypothetical protein J7559_07865 [Cohnella sp.]|nr:hypothetical protein [Cohnella sp.]